MLPTTPQNNQRTRQIKALFVMYDLTQRGFAKKLGVSQQFLSLLIQGKRKSARISQAIADAVHIPVEQLWPDANKPSRRGRKPGSRNKPKKEDAQ